MDTSYIAKKRKKLISYIKLFTRYIIPMEKQSKEKAPFSLLKYFIDLLHRFMKKMKGYEEDKKFFENDNNLYKENGELTQEYLDKIKKYEKYALQENMASFLKEKEFPEEIDKEVINGIIEFTDKRSVLMQEYERKRLELKDLFDPYSWAIEKISEGELTIEEKEERINALNEILEGENIAFLEDPIVKEGLKTIYQDVVKGGEK